MTNTNTKSIRSRTKHLTVDSIPEEERAIDTRAVSELTGLAEITLVQQRARGEGPPFFRIGRSIRYRLGDVLSWRDARTVGGKR